MFFEIICYRNARKVFLGSESLNCRASGWKEPQKIIWFNCSWEREHRWGYLAACPITSSKLPLMRAMPCAWAGCSIQWLFPLWKMCYIKMSPSAMYMCYLFSPCDSLRTKSVHPLCSCLLGTGIVWWGLFKPSLFQRERRPQSFSLSLNTWFSSPLIIFMALLWTLSYACCFPWNMLGNLMLNGIQKWQKVLP